MISFIIPTLNEEAVIEKILGNLGQIKSFPYEIIVSDGGSKDKTAEIAKKHGAKIIVYNGAKRQTIGGGKNAGGAIATGEHLVFIDADCFINDPDEFFEKALKLFALDSQLFGLTVNLKVMKELETFSDKFFFGLVNITHTFNNNLTHTGSASGEFQMIRRDDYLKLGGYNENLIVFEDNDMFIRLARIGRTRMAKELTVFHTGRRAHKIGWPRLLYLWITNALSYAFFKKSTTKEWHPVR